MSGQDQSSKYKPLLIQSIREIRQLKERLEKGADPTRPEPVAIVGAGCRFPGASGVGAYWDFLARGGDGVREIPAERWPVDEHFDADPARVGKIYTRSAGFIDGIDRFDADFFGMSPREAAATDPQHRLLLEVAWEALENAAIVPAQLRGTRTGVYVGIMGQDYGHLTRDPRAIDLHTGIGNLGSVAAGRLAYWLGVHGPTLSIDTACSSSLVAIHLACQSLRSGEADLALAGGVNLIISPFVMMMISTARMLAPDGRCKTFDQSADGFGRGEGCGVVVLKRLADAQRDGDRVIAVIRGTAINHDGRSAGLTVPSQQAQTAVIRQALADAGVTPLEVQYLEAHGTGTSLGDPIEIAAAAEAYGAERGRAQPLVVGSVKTNFGHLEGAAGVASLLKAALALREGVVPPHLRLTRPNPHIDWDALSITVPLAAQPWPAAPGPRLAGVSSFGVSGTNAHLVLSEPPAAPARRFDAAPCRVLLAFSAQSAEALRDKATALARCLGEPAARALRLEDVSHTLLLGRQHFEHRAAFVVADAADAVQALDAFLQGQPDTRRRAAQAPLGAASSQLGRLGQALVERSLGCREQAAALQELLLGLADLYCQGHAPEWPQLFAGLPVQRIELPTYPFQRQRYWVADSAHGAVPGEGAPRLHPLLHSNTSDFSEQRYSAVFDGREFFLADHRVHGRKLLPGVACLEMARAALELASGGHVPAGLRLRHVAWPRPLVVEERPVRVHVALRPEASGALAYEVYGDGAEGRVGYGQGLVEAMEAAEPPHLDLPALRAQCGREAWTAADCYDRFERAGLQYGAGHRAIESLYLGEEQVLGRLVLPASLVATREQFGLHPSLMDAALQSLIGLEREAAEGSRTSVPFALDELEIWGPCSERLWVLAQALPGGPDGQRLRKFDLTLCDDEGRVCVRARGFSARVLDAEPAPAGAVPATLLFQPLWQAAPAPVPATATATASTPSQAQAQAQAQPAERLVLLCDSPVAPAALAERLGVPCEALAGDYTAQAEALLLRLQALLQHQPAQPLLVQVVVPVAGERQLSAGLAGLLGTARLEQPRLGAQVLAVGQDDGLEALAAKLEDNARSPQDLRVRHAGGQRQVAGWGELAAVPAVKPWKDGGVYLLVGGLGGLGRIFAREIAAQVRGATLVLTGRRALDAAGRQHVRELEALGANVEVHAVDVADRAAVERLLLQVQERHQALDGIVHAAGVLRDSLLPNKSASALREVLAPKVAGLLHLDAASRDLALECFLCFSSVSAVRGHVGQSDYAAANAFMDAFAAWRNGLVAAGQRRGRTLSVNWPLWREGGMQVDAATERAVTQATGMGAMSTASGIDALYRAWGSGLDQVVVMAGDPARLRQALAGLPALPEARTAAPAADRVGLLEQAGRYFRERFARALHLPVAKVDLDAPLEKYGIDSIIVMDLTRDLESVFGSLSKTLFFEYQTLRALTEHFVEHHAARLEAQLGPAAPAAVAAPVRTAVPARRPGPHWRAGPAARAAAPAATQDIAIIGLAGRYPGARELAAFWDNLRQGVDCITEVPAERWDHGAYFDPDQDKPGKTYAKWGGFIDGVAEFDPLFFGIAPREAELIDPQERLFLQCAYAALEDAGYTHEALQRLQASGLKGNVGVYVGVMYEEYQLHAAQQQLLGNAVTVTASPASIANRVSYFLNLHGPSLTLDTMCSSSLTAIHLACEALQRGGCELAIAGGVNVSIHPNKYLMLGQGRFASSKGQCESFGRGGDGYVPGEGVGAVILKPLAQAEADGDPIHGVIKASAINHGGKTHGYTVPNPLAQANVIARAIEAADIPARAISYVEAHGTGTSLGDPIEINGLSRAFAEHTQERQFCAIGSVKSNIGHAESAAGIAGLTKVLLQMRHGQLVPSLHSRALNPNIDFPATPFVVQQALAEWKRPVLEIDGVARELPRIAGLSSFGAGGANAHLIVQEYRPARAVPGSALPPGQPALVPLSARNAERLQERVRQLLQAVERGEVGEHNLADAAYTLQVGREAMEARLALAVASVAQLREKLLQVLDGQEDIADVYRGDVKRHQDELALLGADEELAALVAGWVARGRWGKLLELWVKGLPLDWQALHGKATPRRISLPTYPFARQHCWLPLAAPAAVAAAGVAPLHPLVQRNTSDFGGQRYSATFDGREFFLADHRVRGRKVLPGVAHLEMARAALQLAEGGEGGGVRLREVVWSRPLVVEDGQPVEVHVGLYPEDGGPVAFEVLAEAPDAQAQLCSQGLVELMEARAPERIELQALRAQCAGEAWSAADCYAKLGRAGLQYGPAHQAIETLYRGEALALARLVLPAAVAATRGRFVLHPSLLDAALQSLIGLPGVLADDGSGSALPFALDELEVLGDCGECLWAVARPAAGSRAGDRVRKFDLLLCDDEGLVCARLRGLSTRVLDGLPVAGAAAAPATLLAQPQWRVAPARASAGVAPAWAGHWVLLCGSPVDPAALSARLGVRCERLDGSYAAQAEALLARLQALVQAHPGEPLLVQVLVPVFGPGQLSAALAGMLRSARREHPRLTGQVIALEGEDEIERLAAAVAENARAAQDVQVRYADGTRQVLGWRELEPAAAPPLRPWKAGGVYLLTGGLGGLGRAVALEIARQAPGAVLVLSGRRALDDAGRQALRALEALGATVEYHALDVAEREAVQRLVLQVQERHERLDGIVHSAGVLRDGLLARKSSADLAAVLAPKVAGLLNLDEASRAIELDCFLCFSSLTAVHGNVGQADYAAANAFMDAFAAHRNALAALGQRHGRTLSLNWPLWREGGMQLDAAAERAMEQATGLVALGTEAGLEALYRAWGSGQDQVLVMAGDAARLRRDLAQGTDAGPAAAVAADAAPRAQVPHADAEGLLAQVRRLLLQTVSALLKVRIEDIDPEAEFNDYGFDSVSLTGFGNRLNQDCGTRIAPTLFFEYPTLNGLAAHLAQTHAALFAARFGAAGPVAAETVAEAHPPAPAEASRPRPGRARRGAARPMAATPAAAEPIAIIGMSGCFPQAADVEAFWRNLLEGRDCITEVPAGRWDWRAVHGDPAREANKTLSKWGGFMDGVDEFDPLFFGISPKEAELMDPQQRLLMQHVWNCIEDAGYAAASLQGTRTALFVGTGSSGYASLVARAGLPIEGATSTGAVPSVGPNRMSFFLDLHGPSEPVETACSSALVAMRRGVQALASGECELAIVGGVNTLVTPEATISFSKAGMLSEDGRCKTFSAGANGYVRGEGVGMLLLKRLSAAERDGDSILALVRGSAENHGGRANSLTAPNPKAQAELIKAAFRQAGIDPRTVGYIEAHGTGTPLGDPIEVNGLKAAFQDLYADTGDTRVASAHCGLGSVKTNIGHLELAAGVAGVIKVLLQLQHRTLVPSLHCDALNPYIELDGSPFHIVREAREWAAPRDADGRALPRRAGVSSFGFGGVNAHVVLEEYVPAAAARTPLPVDAARPALVVLSARNAQRLQERVRQLCEAIRRGVVTQDNLADAAYTLQVGREAMEVRLGLVASSLQGLAAQLDAVLAGEEAVEGLYRGEVRRHKQELALFMADEDAAQMLEAWLAKRKYGKLLELWAKGLSLDWARLYGECRPRRLRLPAYPFARERCWVPAPQAPAEAATAALHPLVHRNTSNLAEQRYSSAFTGDEFFLADHFVRGDKVLPGVAHLEMARTAVAQALELDAGTGVCLKNVVFSRPIALAQPPLECEVVLRPDGEGQLAYRIQGRAQAGAPATVYSQGAAALIEAEAPRQDLGALRAACTRYRAEPEPCYAFFAAHGLVLGPSFRVLREVHVGEQQVVGRLELPASLAAQAGRFVLHPCMMDAALQASVGLTLAAGETGARLALPFALERLEILGPTTRAMWSWVRRSAGSQPGDRVQKFDVDLCDDEGRVRVRFRGFSTRIYEGGTGAEAAEPVAGEPRTLLWQPQWQPALAPVGEAPAYSERLVLLCDRLADAAALSARLGAACETLPPDYTAQAEALLARLQALLGGKAPAPVLVQVVVPAQGPQQVSAGLAGLLRSARREHSRLAAQLIAVDRMDDVAQLAARLEDNARSPQDVQVRYGEGERQVLAWSELADGPALVPWKERGVYLLTGGLGGLGQVFAREIAQRARGATLVLTGRRALDDAARESLRALETLGATVQYRVLDVADREAVRQLVLQVHEDHAALDGIVHGAGVLRDSLLLNKTPQGLREVLAAKVAGLVHLDEASRDIALDCFLCFSSIAAVTGNAGQADYAAANGFMDAYAAWRNSLVAQGQRHGHTLSLNWPLWCEGGMRVDEATERAMQQATGLVALRTASGIEALYRALGSGQDQVLVMEGEPARLRTLLAGTPAAAAAQAAPGATPAAPVVIADTPTVVAAAPVAATAVPAPAARGEGGSTAERIKALLLGVVAAQAKIRPERIKGDTELNAYGFDSIMLTELGNRLNHEYGLDLTPTAFFEYPTLDALSQYLAAGHAARFAAHLGPVDAAQAAPPTAAPAVAAASVGVARALPMAANRLTALLRPTPPAAAQRPGAAEPIAIIGISGRFPQAGDLDALWEVLREGRDCVGEVPARRWDMSRYYDPQPGRLGKSSSRWGGFIDGVDEFDALFFQISPREALALDPQARLFLQTAWSLLEGSGYTREGLRERHQGRVGVYVGAMAQPTHPADDGDKPIAALSASSAIANRVSHYFNLEGPSFAVDTMCSSALMALHLACRDLQQGECSMAIAGGVCLLLSPQKYVGMSQARLFGSSPASRSFNEGDGYQPAETVGAVLLKPLSRAVADGDPILALVTGTATYHSGRSNGYAAPNPKMQARVMAESLRRAGVGAGDIGWVEAAATGAALGDAVEVAALGSVFAGLRESGRRVPVGAVKSNLGHSEHGSAIAQLAKVLLQMKHGQLAPLLSIGTPNRQLRLDESPLALQRELAAWEAPLGPDGRRLPRRALVNSFAAGGSYLSLVVEEYLPPGAAAVPADTPPGPQLFVFSARDGERLRAVVEQTLHRLEREPGVALRDLAYTLQVGREAMDARLALVADSHAALRERLQAWLAGGEAADAAPASPQPSDEALAAMVARRDLEGLARCWMQGAVLPWAALHAGAPARRIEWATYPFARTVFPIDYEQTPAPAAATQGVPATAQAVDGALDEVVLRAVAGALGVPLAELPLDRPLQALGYTSIAAMELKYRLEAALRCEIGLELIRDAGRTANELARQLADAAPRRTAAAEAASPALPVLVPQPQARHEPFPLTDMQEAFLIGRQSAIDGDQVGAHIYVEIEVHGALDLYRLNRAWNRLVAQHEMLRAVMLDDGRQRVLPEVPEFRCKVIDFRVMDEAERHAKAALLRDAMEHRVFGAGEWPLFDIRVAVHGEGRRRIHFSIDELIVDGLSVDTLIRQWDWMYAHPQQEPAALELSFRDYVLAMKAFEGSQRYRQDLAYWLQRLADLPGGPQFPRPAQAPAAGARRRTRLTHHLPAPQWEALKARAAALGVSSTALVLSVFAELLRGWTDSPSFTLVLTYFNRPPLHPQVRELVGPAISSLLFVVEPRSGEDFEAVVRAQHERLWQALEHSSVSGVQALRQLRARRGRGAPQTLPVVFTSMLGSEVTSEPLQHLGDVAYVVNQTPQVYLDHQLRDGADGLDCSWDVVEDWFAPGFVRALFQAYGRALEGLADGSLAWTVASFAPPQPADPVTAQLAAWAAEAQAEDPLAPFELTDQQQAYAFGRDTRLEGGGSSCQYYQALHVQRLDAARLEQALAALVERHPMLRTVVDAGGSQAVLARVPQVAIERHDLRAHDAPQRRAALEATRHALLGRVTPLGGWPYFAVAVSLLEGEAACVHLCFDLLLADSTSIGQLIVELIALYEQPASLPAPPALSFRAWQRAVERFKGTPAHAERLAYWQRKFAALPPGPALPQRLGAHASHEVRGLTNPVRAEPVEALQQHPGACPSTGSGRTGTGLFGDPFRSEAEEHQRLDGELRHWGALQQQARARGVAPGLVLLAAYLEVLYAWNGCQPLSVVVPGWERLPVHPDIERVVGDFTTLSWVTRGAQVLSFEQRLQAVAREHAQDLAQRPVSGLQALRRVMLRERQRQLRFPVVFTNHITPLQLPGHRFTLGEAMSKTPQVYLDNLSSEAGERLRCSWDFAGGVYAPAMVQAMFEGYLRLLELLGSEPGAWQRSDFNDQIQAPQGACAATPEKLEGVV